MKICFISPEYLPLSGGTGAYVYYLSKELIRNGCKTYIITGYSQTKDITFSEHHKVFFLRTSKTPIVKSFLFAASSSRKIGKIKSAFPVDIVHANLPLVPNFAVPLSYGKTLVSTVHSTWKGEAEAIQSEPYSRLNSNEKFLVSFTWFLRIFEEKLLERSSKLIAVSEFTKKELMKYYNIGLNKIRVIHNGVDVKKFHPEANKQRAKAEIGLNPQDITILSVGRLYARKGLFTLIETMPSIVKQFKNAKLVISGKGQSTEMKKLMNHAKRLGIRDSIIFTGYFPDTKLPKLYQAADIFAFSTFYEHHPFAILEAMSTGLPIVTNNVGGIPETIENGKTGFLCTPSNPREFSEKILYLLHNPRQGLEMGKMARKTILENYDWRLLVNKVRDVYEEVLS